MAAPPMLFRLPVQMDTQITIHFDMHAAMWHRHVTTVLVDQGGPYLIPHRFEAWFREGLHGQVIDPDPLQELPSPGRSEIDGHEEGDAMDTDEEDPEEDPEEDSEEEPEQN
ncbi:Protein-serine/threonine phosphatase [Psidium guajava]|nr:Protein-serine/threonine phosphatase [Psidium guajava]